MYYVLFGLGCNVINLLSIPLQENSTSNKKRTQQHLVYIKNIDLFMRKRSTKGSKFVNRRQLCLRCLNFFKDKSTLKKHSLLCTNKAGQAEFYPEPGDRVQFKNHNHKEWLIKSKPVLANLQNEQLLDCFTFYQPCFSFQTRYADSLTLKP